MKFFDKSYKITSPYGVPRKYTVNGIVYNDIHTGTDYATPIGTPIYAPIDGTVINRVDRFGGLYFDLVGINERWRAVHLSHFVVKNDKYVKKGTLIARTGSTGKVNGPHCHVERWLNGERVDPDLFISSKYMTFKDLVYSQRNDVREAGVDVNVWWNNHGRDEFIWLLAELGREDVMKAKAQGKITLKDWYFHHGSKEYDNIWKKK